MAGSSDKRELKPTEPFWKASEPARPADPPAPPAAAEATVRSAGNQIEARTLVVGAGMSVSGTITSCDRLVAEGTVDAKLEGCQQVVVAESGVFRGNVSTENADVHGRFEGELVVKKHLLVRAAGQVSGSVSYGEIEIESGGKIAGQIKPHGADIAKHATSPSPTHATPNGSNGSAPHLIAATDTMFAGGAGHSADD